MHSYQLKRYPGNPILTPGMCPYPAELVFNAGVVRHQGMYYMLFRNDREHLHGTIFRYATLGMATSEDGIHFTVYKDEVFRIQDLGDEEIERLYDVRLVELEGKVYANMAVETKHGLRAGIGVTDDFIHLRMISQSLPDNRNLVLFPERIGGRYMRMERPFTYYNNRNYDVWISESEDLIHWGNSRLLIRHEEIPIANAKIGPGTPPIPTKWGWLSIMHAVDFDPSRQKNGYEPLWQKRYCAYALLLDKDNPAKVLGISKDPVLSPEADYEISGGFRNNVVFPMGLIQTDEDSVRCYYGAADTVQAVAQGSIEQLVKTCIG